MIPNKKSFVLTVPIMQNLIYLLVFLLIIFTSYSSEISDKKVKTTKQQDTAEIKKPQKIASLTYYFNQLSNDSTLIAANISVFIVDDSSKSELLGVNTNLALTPASTMKILTTGAALEILGGGRNFKTSLEYSGNIENGVLNGNIYIRGGGDPTLGSQNNGGNGFLANWASAISDLGVDSINGGIIADAQLFDTDVYPVTWSWGEINSEYCAMPSALSIYGNQYRIKVRAGKTNWYKPSNGTLNPWLPNVYFRNQIKSGSIRKASLFALGQPYTNRLTIRGIVPNGNLHIMEGAIPDPPYLVAYQLYKEIEKLGISIVDSAISIRQIHDFDLARYKNIRTEKRKEISARYSSSVSNIVISTNTNSNNLYAETLLKHIALKHGSSETEVGANAITNFWAQKLKHKIGVNIFDGSGISRYNTLTTKFLVDALQFISDSSDYSTIFRKSLPIAGETGTLRRLCKNTQAKGKIIAKSGSMSRVLSYAGYINSLSGNKYTFAIIINNFSCSHVEMRKKIENLLTQVVVTK